MGKLEDKYIVPPLSVLDTKQGYWKNRKKQWVQAGIDSASGRGAGLLGDGLLKLAEKNKKM